MSEILIDFSRTGNLRPWKRHKVNNSKLSDLYRHLAIKKNDAHYRVKADRIDGCAESLFFAECPNGHGKRLEKAFFCKQRLCFMCQWRKSLFVYHQFLQVAHRVLELAPDSHFLLLTLTAQNCRAEDLKKGVTHQIESFRRLTRYKRVKAAIRGVFRTNECTYNAETGAYHPHIHCILAISKSYFTGKYYINQEEWSQFWKKALQVDYKPIVDIRKVRKKRKDVNTVYEDIIGMDQDLYDDSLAGAGAEISKYAAKVSDVIRPKVKPWDRESLKAAKRDLANNRDWQAEVVDTLDNALTRRRLASYTGIFKKAYQDIGQKDVEDSGLIRLPGEEEKVCTCPICQSELVQIHYLWREKRQQYIKKREMKIETRVS